jgi:hypothetical protein
MKSKKRPADVDRPADIELKQLKDKKPKPARNTKRNESAHTKEDVEEGDVGGGEESENEIRYYEWFWNSDKYPGNTSYSQMKWLLRLTQVGYLLQIVFLSVDWVTSTSWSRNTLFSPAYAALGLSGASYIADIIFLPNTLETPDHVCRKLASQFRGVVVLLSLGDLVIYVDALATNDSTEKYFVIAVFIFVACLMAMQAIVKNLNTKNDGYSKVNQSYSEDDGPGKFTY